MLAEQVTPMYPGSHCSIPRKDSSKGTGRRSTRQALFGSGVPACRSQTMAPAAFISAPSPPPWCALCGEGAEGLRFY